MYDNSNMIVVTMQVVCNSKNIVYYSIKLKLISYVMIMLTTNIHMIAIIIIIIIIIISY
jgi:hypothetical protein